jgi:hypothetical protein
MLLVRSFRFSPLANRRRTSASAEHRQYYRPAPASAAEARRRICHVLEPESLRRSGIRRVGGAGHTDHMTEPSPYFNCGSLHELTRPEDWAGTRPVYIDTGAGPERVIYADHMERVQGVPSLVLRSYLPWEQGSATAAAAWVLEWAGPFDAALPGATAHRSEAGVQAAIATVARELGVEPVEEARPGPMRIWHCGELVAMVRELELLD